MVAAGRIRRIEEALGLAVVVLVLSSCVVGETDGARLVTNTSATLDGRLGSTADGEGTYWFEYGSTTDYGRRTPPSTSDVEAGRWTPVSREVADLEPGTTYHFRLCGRSSADQGTCGPDETLTTGVARGRVRGSFSYWISGLPWSPTTIGLDLSLDVVGDLDGGPHLEGSISYRSVIPGTIMSGPLHEGRDGPPTCVRIAGNRATVGFWYHGALFDRQEVAIIIEDDGPTGDRVLIDRDPEVSCPDPASADLPETAGFDGGPGDFTVEGG